MTDQKKCFFIAPIGDEGGEIRERSDTLMEYIVDEAVSDYDYSVLRADRLDEPGSITSQIIQRTVESELVIADLTGHNPNVFYELAVRHATGEPYIQLIESTESIPFDVSGIRTIKYGLDVEEADKAKEQIRAQLDSITEGQNEFDNPISRSAEIESLLQSTDPTDQNLADILRMVSNLDRKIDRLEGNVLGQETEPVEDPDLPQDWFSIGNRDYKIEGDTATTEFIHHISQETGIEKNKIINYLQKIGYKIDKSW